MISVHIPIVNPSVIFNIMGKDKFKTFDYINDQELNNDVESMIGNFIAKQFEYQRIGKLNRVDLVRKFNTKNKLPYYSVFCHFNEWTTSVVGPRWFGKTFLENIRQGIPCKLYYEEFSYWILTLNPNPLTKLEAMLHRSIRDKLHYINNVLNTYVGIVNPLGKTLNELEQINSNLDYVILTHKLK